MEVRSMSCTFYQILVKTFECEIWKVLKKTSLAFTRKDSPAVTIGALQVPQAS